MISVLCASCMCCFFFSSRRRHTRCALVTGVQTCALPIYTYVLGAFNPGMTRLASGNLLLMVRIAEALREPIRDGHIHAIRWFDGGYTLDAWPLEQVDTADPRKFTVHGGGWPVMAQIGRAHV